MALERSQGCVAILTLLVPPTSDRKATSRPTPSRPPTSAPGYEKCRTARREGGEALIKAIRACVVFIGLRLCACLAVTTGCWALRAKGIEKKLRNG